MWDLPRPAIKPVSYFSTTETPGNLKNNTFDGLISELHKTEERITDLKIWQKKTFKMKGREKKTGKKKKKQNNKELWET